MKKIALLLMITTASVANQADSSKISHNEVINYKAKYVQKLEEFGRLQSLRDNLADELSSLKTIGSEIKTLKEDISDTYQPRIDLIKPLSKGYSDAYIRYYELVYAFRQTDFSKRIIDHLYDYILDQYNKAYIFAKTKITDDDIELDFYSNIKVNGEKLVK